MCIVLLDQMIDSPDLVDHVDAGPTAIYCGVDPTASSLHLGNLVTLLGLLHFHIKGHTTIGLVSILQLRTNKSICPGYKTTDMLIFSHIFYFHRLVAQQDRLETLQERAQNANQCQQQL